MMHGQKNIKLNINFGTYIWKLFFPVFSDQSFICHVVFPTNSSYLFHLIFFQLYQKVVESNYYKAACWEKFSSLFILWFQNVNTFFYHFTW